MSEVLQNQEGTGRKLQKRDYTQEHCLISRLPPWQGALASGPLTHASNQHSSTSKGIALKNG